MSKGLEALENIKHYDTRVGLHEKDYELIEKELKALEIIKERDVDVGWLKRAGNLYHYNMGMGIKSYGALIQEEYDLLKEVLL